MLDRYWEMLNVIGDYWELRDFAEIFYQMHEFMESQRVLPKL